VSLPPCAVESKSKRNRFAAGGDGAISISRVLRRLTLRRGLLRWIKSHARGGGDWCRRDVLCHAPSALLPLRDGRRSAAFTVLYPEQMYIPKMYASPFSSSPPLFLRRLPFFFVASPFSSSVQRRVIETAGPPRFTPARVPGISRKTRGIHPRDRGSCRCPGPAQSGAGVSRRSKRVRLHLRCMRWYRYRRRRSRPT
jgi:hypothetical protein